MNRPERRPGRPVDPTKAEDVLAAGWALFLERGVGATSMEAVAAAAGVSKMTVYKLFANKRVLFEAAVLREMTAIEAAQTPEATVGSVPLEDELRVFGEGLMTFLAGKTAVDFYAVLFGEISRHPGLAKTFYACGPGRTLANLAAILLKAADRLRIESAAEASIAAEALFGLWQGASNFRLAPRTGRAARQEVADRVQRGVDLFLRAYAREPATKRPGRRGTASRAPARMRERGSKP